MLSVEDLQDIKEIVQEIVRSEIRVVKDELGDDITRLSSYVLTNTVSKTEFNEFREEMGDLRENLNTVVTNSDKWVGAVQTLREEYAVISVQLSRQYQWNHKVGEKVGISFEY